MRKSTTNEFISKAIEVHGNKYNYSKVVYVNNKTKVIIGCPIHGDFEQQPRCHSNGQGCKKCNHNIPSTGEFILKSRLIHGNKYDYSKFVYVNNKTKGIIICPVHGDFEQPPNHHNTGIGCPKCAIKNKKLTDKEFISKAIEVHGNKYDYSKVVYVNNKTKGIIICPVHGDFKQKPNDHLNGNGCPKCSCFKYSKIAITWIKQIIEKENIYIQHAENEGEYRIPGTNYFADGYCKQNNTIYEFYGDYFHGNPNLFEKHELCHPYKDECAGTLYMKTRQREQEIKKLGYNLMTIWENDYKYIKRLNYDYTS